MDFQEILNTSYDTLMHSLPIVLKAVGVLVAGWIVAILVRWVVRKALGVIDANKLLQSGTEHKIDVERGVSKGAYYLVLLLALIAFFNVLRLDLVSQPLQALVTKIADYLPNLISGGVLALVAWVVATVVRKLAKGAMARTDWDEKLQTGAGMKPMTDTVADILYFVILLIFLPAILGALKLEGLLNPVQNMLNEAMLMVPNIAAAVAIAFVGWFLARVVRDVVTNLLTHLGADKLGESAGLKGTMPLSRLVGLILFVAILVPTAIAALDALKIEAISGPSTLMLTEFTGAVPDILAAALILIFAMVISRFVGEIVAKLLGGFGFDRLPEGLGLGRVFPEGMTPSRFMGRLAVFFILLFATVEAANRLGFYQVSDLVTLFIGFGGDVLLGIAIIAIGLWIANLAHGAVVRQSGRNSAFWAGLARFAIMGIVLAMGLNAMGIAPDIVELAFGLTLGAIAVAVALSFGLGGREAAGKQMDHWFAKLRGGGGGPGGG